jgi:uncharacterized protein (DUF1697 family)
MAICVALLRAVNVAGYGGVSMSALRTFFEELGFAGARTLLQSGNVVFDDDSLAGPVIERRLEAEAEKRLGLRTAFFVRSAAEWAALIAENPFPDEAERDPSHLVAVCLKDEPSRAAVTALQAAIKGPELVRVGSGRQVYISYPAGIGRSKLTASVIERVLGSAGTARNWNTVLKLEALARG